MADRIQECRSHCSSPVEEVGTMGRLSKLSTDKAEPSENMCIHLLSSVCWACAWLQSEDQSGKPSRNQIMNGRLQLRKIISIGIALFDFHTKRDQMIPLNKLLLQSTVPLTNRLIPSGTLWLVIRSIFILLLT